ncbi:MAG: hypothetical protein QOJ98_3461 [Acidobacteriota bacterium]|jgi:hypothetical protein|nr:hypothetical protein [Acidobacteriota bacterium]
MPLRQLTIVVQPLPRRAVSDSRVPLALAHILVPESAAAALAH